MEDERAEIRRADSYTEHSMDMAVNRVGERRGIFVVVLTVALLCLGIVVQPAMADEARRFCRGNYADGYSSPFDGMRSLSGPPVNGHLPFVPKALEFLPVGLGQPIVGGGSLGFYFTGYLKQPRVVDWEIETRLVVVNQKGKPLAVRRERVQEVKKLNDPDKLNLAFAIGRRPGFYRVDVVFRNSAGGVLGKYAEYFQAARRVVSTRLALNAQSYKAGDVLLMRLENLGTVMLGFGSEFTAEMWTGTRWEASPITPKGWTSAGFGLGAGQAQSCQRFQLPAELEAGRYRIVKPYGIGLVSRQDRFVATEFEAVR